MKMPRQPIGARAQVNLPAVPRRSVEVRIEELVLHGFAPGDRHAIADAVQIELANLMQAEALPARGQNELAFKRIDGGAFQIKRGFTAGNSGTQIAQSVFRGLRRQMRGAVAGQAIQAVGARKQ